MHVLRFLAISAKSCQIRQISAKNGSGQKSGQNFWNLRRPGAIRTKRRNLCPDERCLSGNKPHLPLPGVLLQDGYARLIIYGHHAAMAIYRADQSCLEQISPAFHMVRPWFTVQAFKLFKFNIHHGGYPFLWFTRCCTFLHLIQVLVPVRPSPSLITKARRGRPRSL